MKNFISTLLIAFMVWGLQAQNTTPSIFTNGDRIHIDQSNDGKFFYTHKIQKGHTLYSLAKAFDLSLADIYHANSLSKESTLGLGQTIRIPINNKNLYTPASLKNIEKGHYLPVYYTIQSKDNLYRISKIYFNQDIQLIAKRNNLSDYNLSVGRDLIIGWINVNKVKKDVSPEVEVNPEMEVNIIPLPTDASPTISETLARIIELDSIIVQDSATALEIPSDFNLSLLGIHTYSEEMKVKNKAEVAFWDKTIPDNGMVFALHEDALMNSYIHLYNPLVKRSVRAKVIGRIPYGTYTSNIKLVLSPRAAKQLGARDRRFKVEAEFLTK